MVRICAVVGCSSSTYFLKKWHEKLCDEHGRKYGSCYCKPPFTLFPFPTERKDLDARRRWVKLINRMMTNGDDWQPTYQDRVCSLHFKDGEPSTIWPDPTEKLGFDPGKSKSRRGATKERPPDSEKIRHKCLKRAVRTVSNRAQVVPVKITPVLYDVEDAGKRAGSENRNAASDLLCSSGASLHDHAYSSSRALTESCPDCRDKQAKIAELEVCLKKLKDHLLYSQTNETNSSASIMQYY